MAIKKEETIGGRKISSGLFIQEDPENGVYDLNEFRKEFLDSADSTGYYCAKKLLVHVPEEERWAEWKRIFEGNTRLQRVHQSWIEELDILTRADAERQIAKGCDPKDFARLKYIREGNLYRDRKVGRPTKGQASKEQRIKDAVKHTTKEDLDRVISLGKG